MNIKLLKKFYSVNDISEITDIIESTIREKIRVLDISPDIQVNNINMYSEDSKNKIIGFYEFEKTFSEVYYSERNKPKDKFEIIPSKMNLNN